MTLRWAVWKSHLLVLLERLLDHSSVVIGLLRTQLNVDRLPCGDLPAGHPLAQVAEVAHLFDTSAHLAQLVLLSYSILSFFFDRDLHGLSLLLLKPVSEPVAPCLSKRMSSTAVLLL